MTSKLNTSVLSDSPVSHNGLKSEKRLALNSNTSPSANNNGFISSNKKPSTPTDNRTNYKRWSISGWLNSVSKREKKQSPVNNQQNALRNLTDSKSEQQTKRLDSHSKEKHSPSTRSTTGSHFNISLKLEDKFDALSLKESVAHVNKYKIQVTNKNLEKLRTNSFREQHTSEPSKSPRLNRFFKELNENKNKSAKSSSDAKSAHWLKLDSRTKYTPSFYESKSLDTSNLTEESLCGCDSNNNSILQSPIQTELTERTVPTCVSYVNTNLSEYFRSKSEEWCDYHHNLVDSHCHLEMIFSRLAFFTIYFKC